MLEKIAAGYSGIRDEKKFGIVLQSAVFFLSLQRQTINPFYIMTDSKLISVRLDQRDLDFIDRYCEQHRFYKRSRVINHAVTLAVALLKKNIFRKVEKFRPYYGDVLDDFKIEYHREVQ